LKARCAFCNNASCAGAVSDASNRTSMICCMLSS
jgi:hypothetical protein